MPYFVDGKNYFFLKNDKKMKSFIGYSLDKDLRYRATSGGVGSSLLKWLFNKKIIETSISLSYNRKTLHYEPYLIHSFEEYQITGSVYHEIDLVSFIKANVKNIKGANSTSKCEITKCFCKSTPLVLRNSISFLVSH